MRTLHYCLLLTIFAGFISSCEKDKDTNPQNDTDSPKNTVDSVGDGRSRVKSVSFTNSGTVYTYSLSYNSTGNLQSISEEFKGEEKGYENYYWSETGLQYEFYCCSGVFEKTGNYTRNSDGYVLSGELTESVTNRMFGGTEHVTTNFNCIYDENNQLISVTMDATNTLGSAGNGQVNYVWENGNLVSIENSGWLPGHSNTYHFEYYTDKPEMRDIGLEHFTFSGYEEVNVGLNVGTTPSHRYGFTPGGLPFLSKNLLKKVTSSIDNSSATFENTYEYTYDFDDKGRVVRETVKTTTAIGATGTERNYEYFD